MMCEALDWRHLPYSGGILDQPDWLMEDLMTIAAEVSAQKRLKKDG
jgi:hypothetical protein